MPVVKFIKENKEIEVPAGANLRQEAIKAGINVHRASTALAPASTNSELPRLRPVRHVPGEDHQGHGPHQPDGLASKSSRFHNPLPDPIPVHGYIGNEDTMRLACS